MVTDSLNKMQNPAPAGIRYRDGGAYYVNRCACGQFVDVPSSGEKVRCACGVKHVWPKGDPSVCRRPYGVRIVRVKNPSM